LVLSSGGPLVVTLGGDGVCVQPLSPSPGKIVGLNVNCTIRERSGKYNGRVQAKGRQGSAGVG